MDGWRQEEEGHRGKGAKKRAGEPHPQRRERVEGRKIPYTPTQTRPTALPDGDPNLPHVWVTLGGLKGPTKCRPSCHRDTLLSRPNPRLPSPRSPSIRRSRLPLRLVDPHRRSLSRKSAPIYGAATFTPSSARRAALPSRNVLNGRHGTACLFISTSGPAITTYDGDPSCGREFESTSKTERQFRQSTSREKRGEQSGMSVASVCIGVNPGKSRKRNHFRINAF